jgi:hypothetical protein
MPWTTAMNDRFTLLMMLKFIVSDCAINREHPDICLRLSRFIHSRRRSRALMRAFRRTAPLQSKHFGKPCGEFANDVGIHRFLEENGLLIAVHVFFNTRLPARESGLRFYEHM